MLAFDGNNTTGPLDVATACRAKGGSGHGDFESETFVTVGALQTGHSPNGHGMAGVNDQAVASGHVVPILEAGARTGTSTDDPRAGIGIGEPGDPMFTLQRGKQHAIAFEPRFVRNGRGAPDEITSPLKAESGRTGKGDGATCVATGMAVRRLTPRECERLQGFPDDYTLVPYRGKESADGPRYKGLGNSWAVPVPRWIGTRIEAVEALLREVV